MGGREGRDGKVGGRKGRRGRKRKHRRKGSWEGRKEGSAGGRGRE